MSEADIQRQIIEFLKLRGGIVFRMNAGRGRQNQHLCPVGTPDLLAVLPHATFWVEVKDMKGKVTDEQEAMHKRLRDCGHNVIIARSIDDIEH